MTKARKTKYAYSKFGEFAPYDRFQAEAAILRYHSDKTPENLQIAVQENLRLAAWFTYQFIDKKRLAFLTDDDVYSVCCEYLEKAIRRYDPSRGIRFSSFATRVMLNATVSANIKETVSAKQNDTSEKAHDTIYRAADHREDGKDSTEIQEAIALVEAWVKKNLSKRMQIIYRDRRDGVTLEETAKKLKVSRERIRQLHRRIVRNITNEFDFLRQDKQ